MQKFIILFLKISKVHLQNSLFFSNMSWTKIRHRFYLLICDDQYYD
jgi:hypothetical protein